MINVRIRDAMETDAAPLGQMPWDPADKEAGEKVLEAVRRWGLYTMGEGELMDEDELVGQFVLDHAKGEAFFEVIVIREDLD